MRLTKMPEITLDWLHARTREVRDDADDAHLVWVGYANDGHPKANLRIRGRWTPVNVRRLVWANAQGRQPSKDRMVVCTCDVDNCVAPDCLEAVPWGERSRGKTMPPHIRMRSGAKARAAAKIPQQDVPDIIDSADWLPAGVLMEVYGVSREAINSIRRMEYRHDYSNPFSQLLMAA